MLIGLRKLRKEFDIKCLLNDGGRIMSNSVRDYEVLGEERVTLEPFNPQTLDYTIDKNCLLGQKGKGLDNNEIEKTVLLDSQIINNENTNVYVYSMNESKIFH